WGLSSGKNVVRTEEDLKAAFPEDEWNRRHLQIIYYGREHCPAQRHDAARCEICREFGVKTPLAGGTKMNAAKSAKVDGTKAAAKNSGTGSDASGGKTKRS